MDSKRSCAHPDLLRLVHPFAVDLPAGHPTDLFRRFARYGVILDHRRDGGHCPHGYSLRARHTRPVDGRHRGLGSLPRRQAVAPFGYHQPGPGCSRLQPVRPHQGHDVVHTAGLCDCYGHLRSPRDEVCRWRSGCGEDCGPPADDEGRVQHRASGFPAPHLGHRARRDENTSHPGPLCRCSAGCYYVLFPGQRLGRYR